MLRAVGMTDDDWDKPQIGVASSWNEVTPCNLPLDRLAKRAKEGVREAGGFPLEFVTIAVSDGISMGHEGMRASLVSREVIADSVETMMHAERFDGMVTLAGCDKSLPGHADGGGPAQPAQRLPLRRLDPPGPGRGPGPRHHRSSRRSGPTRSDALTDEELEPDRAQRLPDRGLLRRDVHRQHDGVGGRGARHVAARAARRRRRSTAAATTSPSSPARRWSALLEAGIRPRQIMTKEAFENAIAVTMALGGSTNAVLHLLAIANEARVELEPRRLQPRRPPGCPTSPTPSPTARYHMADLDRIGGVPVVMRELLDAGLLHGDCLTVTGRTVAENLAALDPPAPDGEVVHPLDAPHPRARAGSPSCAARSPRRARW